MLDARLADGSRVNAIIPPLALDGPALSIRRFGTIPLDVDKLVELGHADRRRWPSSWRPASAARLNILISGGTGTGKTTLLNVLSQLDSRRASAWSPSRTPPNCSSSASTSSGWRPARPTSRARARSPSATCCATRLRMRPDRIIIGEVRGAEALDMLQAMNTGHEGSMTTVHANNPRDALRRVENMVSMAGLNYPGARRSASRWPRPSTCWSTSAALTGGRRKIVSIAEITGMEGDTICLQDLFRFRQTGVDADGHAQRPLRGLRRPAAAARTAATPKASTSRARLFQRRTLNPMAAKS